MYDEVTVQGLLLKYSRTWLLFNVMLVATVAVIVGVLLVIDLLSSAGTLSVPWAVVGYLLGIVLLGGISVVTAVGMVRRTPWMYRALFLEFALFVALSAGLLIAQHMDLLTGIPLVVELDVLIGVIRRLWAKQASVRGT